jgi:Dolichyl-phosphate-mannose-protein mannosyltransferase
MENPWLAVLGIAIGMPITAVLTGWALLCQVTALDGEERLLAAFGLGIAILAGAHFLAFTTGLDPRLVVIVAPLLIIGGSLATGWRPWATRLPAARPGALPLGVFFLAYLQLLLIEVVLTQMAGGAWYYDWWMHYDEALIFLGERDLHTVWADTYTIASRNPLYNLAVAAVMALAGSEFWVFQTASAVTNAAVVGALFLVLRDLFGQRAALFGAGLACLNIWLMHLAWFTWSKSLVALYLLMALHFHLCWLRHSEAREARARLDFAAFWLASILAFLTHQLAAPFVLVLLVHAAVRAWREGRLAACLRPIRLAGYGAVALLLLAPWYGWLIAQFGLDRLIHASPVVAMDPEALTPVRMAQSMMMNAVFSVIPNFGGFPAWPPRFAELYRWVTGFYFNSATAALTLTQGLILLTFLVAWLRGQGLRRPRGPTLDRTAITAVALFALGGALLSLPLHPHLDRWGIVSACLFPSVLILLICAAGLISRHGGQRLRQVVVAGVAIEYLIMFWSHLAWLSHLNPGDKNAELKRTNDLVFLGDLLGSMAPVMGTLLAVQLSLISLVMLSQRHSVRDATLVPGSLAPTR